MRIAKAKTLEATLDPAAGTLQVAHLTGNFDFTDGPMHAVSNDAVGLFGSGLSTFASRVAPSLPLYGAAAAILATALGIWWWAEREA